MCHSVERKRVFREGGGAVFARNMHDPCLRVCVFTTHIGIQHRARGMGGGEKRFIYLTLYIFSIKQTPSHRRAVAYAFLC